MATGSVSVPATVAEPDLASDLVSRLLAVRPLWALAKGQARRMMVRRAERLGIPWQATVDDLSRRDWQPLWQAVADEDLEIPASYRASFHGYDDGHLCWEAAFEFEVASNAVHASLYPEAGTSSDRALRDGFHDLLQATLSQPPARVLDLHCAVGLSSFRLKETFPGSEVTGLDFSPHYLSVARFHDRQRGVGIDHWVHALPEATGLATGSFDLVAVSLLLHELPQERSRALLREARRLLAPGGCFALMDMNPSSGSFQSMPAYRMTLLKSTEPFLDAYLTLDLPAELEAAGFEGVSSRPCTPRHRAILGRVPV